MRTRITLLFIMTALSVGVTTLALGATSQPANNGEYTVHADGGIIYNSLSREAKRKGDLKKFEGSAKRSGTLELGGATLTYEVPSQADAYDVVPVKYVLENKNVEAKRPIAVECTAFEDKARTGGRPLFDMSLPGDLSVKIEYVGHVSADRLPSRQLLDPLNPDPAVADGVPWKSDLQVRSGEIRKADFQWFTFRYTVTGNTIFDPEGFNGVQSRLDVYRKLPSGDFKFVCSGVNGWERNTNYQYPGESCEQTILPRAYGSGMPPGEYKLRYSLVRKDYEKWNQSKNYSGGEAFAYMDVFLKVVEGKPDAVEPEVKQVLTAAAKGGDFPEFMHSFEEFMTGFEWFRNPVSRIESVVYVQVAPWTRQLDLKLIQGSNSSGLQIPDNRVVGQASPRRSPSGTKAGEPVSALSPEPVPQAPRPLRVGEARPTKFPDESSPMELAAVSIPITVSTGNLALRSNPDNPFVLNRNGKEEPVIVGQLMPSMRHSIHFSPRPDLVVKDLLKEAQECGVNVYCSESGGYALADFFRVPKGYDAVGELTKYFNSLLVPAGMPILGHGIYGAQESYRFASKLMDPPLNLGPMKSFYSNHHTDPQWAESWAAVVLYNHKLSGGNWYKTRDGRTIIDMEDSIGWMREGIQIRYSLGEKGIRDFQEWVQKKYGTIEKVNHAWSSSYKAFSQINPEENQTASVPHGYKWEYYKKTNPVFYEWSPALEDLDIFRSEARCASYRQILEIVRKTIPNAVIDLRTEGGNFIIPDSSRLGDTPHERHVKYSARRNAMVGEVLAKNRDVIGFYSDYTPQAFTPEEWRKFTRLSAEKGIRSMPLPHLSRTRGVALQQRWGDDYTVHYNLKHPAKGVMVFALQALFPVMQAVYEEGGCPGVIWADYTCDVFVTETQKRELKLLRKAMDKMKE
jgi:hypothetical protein